MKLNIKPLGDRVLVEPLEADTKTASGIIIPDNAKEKPKLPRSRLTQITPITLLKNFDKSKDHSNNFLVRLNYF